MENISLAQMLAELAQPNSLVGQDSVEASRQGDGKVEHRQGDGKVKPTVGKVRQGRTDLADIVEDLAATLAALIRQGDGKVTPILADLAATLADLAALDYSGKVAARSQQVLAATEGGRVRAERLTPERRKEISRLANARRSEKRAARQASANRTIGFFPRTDGMPD